MPTTTARSIAPKLRNESNPLAAAIRRLRLHLLAEHASRRRARRTEVADGSSHTSLAAKRAAAATSARRGGITDDAAKAQMAGRRIDRLRHARGRPVASAIIGRAQVRAALHHTTRNLHLRIAGIDAAFGAAATGVLQRAATVLLDAR